MTGHPGRLMTGHSGRELLGLGALVLLLGTAFVTLLVEPTQASGPPGVEQLAASVLLELPEERPVRPASDRSLGRSPSDQAANVLAEPSAVAAAVPLVLDGMRLSVARLGIDLPLLHGDTVRDTVLRSTPIDAAFLLPSSAPPGSGGNSYIYAHARSGMFLSLWEVRLGDVIEVTAPSSEAQRYVVTEIHPRVVPTDLRYTLPTGDERVTLQTSTGPRDGDPRFVVVAMRSREPAARLSP